MESSTVPGDPPFICGVVEGFYGRPWTTEQRKDLFRKMRKWGMDSYLYAPKDDYKHRAFWRDLYTVEEADHLGSLISAAKENDIRFIYAISPGLDIIYSNSKDVSSLKRKLEQVTQLGCKAFAILFDDIEPEMTKADKEVFKSFAHAQVSVTNEAFQHVSASRFLFCPTQYCATRAVPDVGSSEYLKTIGEKLDRQIDIMWTGPKVISKDISLDSINEITEVFRRPPVIWDNLHANDYDQKRLFLGPYCGRSPQLIQKLRGVLTNPNCEYGANFVAIHTLAQWRFCTEDANKKLENMNSDAKLEVENGDVPIPDKLDPHMYHPIVALKNAIREWLFEFNRGKTVWGPVVKPQIVSVPVPLIPSVNTCIAVTPTATTVTTTSTQSQISLPMIPPPSILPTLVPTVPTVNCSAQDLASIIENGTDQLIPSTSTTLMNSLVEDNKILRADSTGHVNSDTEIHGASGSSSFESKEDKEERKSLDIDLDPLPAHAATQGLEPMDTATPPIPSPQDPMCSEREDVPMAEGSDRASTMSSPDEGVESGNASGSIMNLDSEGEPPTDGRKRSVCQDISSDDLHLLCDLFYLPYEHGAQGIHIMQEFQWLKTNSNVIAGASSKDKCKPEVSEWFQRAEMFDELTKKVNSLATKLNDITNRELLYEIYPYVWDIRGVISLLNSYIKWLALGHFPASVSSFTCGSYTWFSKGWRESFMSGDQEPWVIRGGLTAELQRLIPVDRGNDLFACQAPVFPSSQVYTIRPYRTTDEEAIYKVCQMTFKDGISVTEEFTDFPKLAGDIKIGGYLTLQPDVSFVVEDENDAVVGCAVGTHDGREFRRKLNVSWLEMLRKAYPNTLNENNKPFLKETLSSLSSDMTPVPDEIQSSYPSELRLVLVAPLADPSVSKRLMTCMLAALRANGIFGCFIEVPSQDSYYREFYKKLGFTELDDNFMGRNF